METRTLVNLDVPVIGMGSATTFNVEEESDISIRKQIIDNCIESGSIFIDTSPMYGRAEQALGITMKGRVTELQLATKVWAVGKESGRRQIARSFELLGTDHIHLFQIHNMVDWKTHLPYLETLKEKGKIDLIGISYTFPNGLPEMAEIMKTRRVDTIQVSYNVLEREVEEEILPLADELGMGVLIMRPLGSGSLAKGLQREPDLTPLKEFGITTWPQALLAWCLGDPRIDVLIPATTRPSRVFDNAAAGSFKILPEEYRNHIVSEAQRCLTS